MRKRALLIGGLLTCGGLIGFVGIQGRLTQPFQSLITSDKSLLSPEVTPDNTVPDLIGDTPDLIGRSLRMTIGLTTEDAMVKLANSFLGKSYNAFSLDQKNKEQLRLDLSSFDCFLFVEQLLALSQSRTEIDFVNRVRLMRYRDGNIDYCTRFHYFTQWAKHGVAKGWIEDITPSLKGSTSRKIQLNFMSRNPENYLPMMQKRNVNCIRTQESGYQTQQSYLPLASMPINLNLLRSGDIVGLVTQEQGLDVTHTGILQRVPDGVNLIHAVPRLGVIRSRDFIRYVSSLADVVGISVYRPVTVEESNRQSMTTSDIALNLLPYFH